MKTLDNIVEATEVSDSDNHKPTSLRRKLLNGSLIALLGASYLLTACGKPATATPTSTPAATYTPTATATVKPSPTATPIAYVTLGSPFPSDCGDGIPRIWSNDSFNGLDDNFLSKLDEHHGHVDIFAPLGCDVTTIKGEVMAPATGYLEEQPSGSYVLWLPEGVYIRGIESALEFAGVTDVNLSFITGIGLDFGHVDLTPGNIEKGQSIGEIVQYGDQQKIAYQILVYYNGKQYWLSPTLVSQDGPAWECVSGSPYDCIPEPNDFKE